MTPTTSLSAVPDGADHHPAAVAESDRERIELIKRTVAVGASDSELQLFLYQARRLGLDPLLGQIKFVKRRRRNRDTGEWEEIGTIMVGIDGLRVLAERTGKYAGQDEPEFEERGGPYPYACTVRVYRKDFPKPLAAKLFWTEYAPLDRNGEPMAMWATKPRFMLAKCFSEDTEILTDQGFQRFNRATGRVLQVTPHGLEPTDAVPFVQSYHGDMVTLDSDDLNFCVTPNHDMLTTEGKIEACVMYEQARARPRFWIPRCVTGTRADFPISDTAVRIAAAYLADGSDSTDRLFKIEVSQPRKVEVLRAIGGYASEAIRCVAGTAAKTKTRTITTTTDLVGPSKTVNLPTLLALSQRQARLFVDTLLAFDGHIDTKTGVGRFHNSRETILNAFELACVIAGYSVGQRKPRVSDISTRPTYTLTISNRSEIPVVRWGREYKNKGGNTHGRTGLTLTHNITTRVWCVTVPSGIVVVRRHGFSMLCGNCTESAALRKAFPADLSGLYTEEEFDQDKGETGRPPRRSQRPPHRLSAPREPGIDHDTGEVVDAPAAPTSRDAGAPSPAPTAGTDHAASSESAAPATAPSADTPVRGTTTQEPTALTPEERHALQLLVAQAARAEGLAGRTPGQDWLERHYSARSLERLTDRLDDVRERAMAVLVAHEHHTQGSPPSTEDPRTAPESGTRTAGTHSAGQTPPVGTGAGPDGDITFASPSRPARLSAGEFRALIHKAAVVQRVKSATPGKAWLRERYGTDNPSQLTDAQYEDAVRQARAVVTTVARGPELASPGSIARLEAAFDRLQYDEPGRAGLIRACTGDRTDRAEEMTEVEIRALIDELGGPAPGTLVDTPTATPPSAA